MPRKYAEGTTTPVFQTRGEIESLLRKHGAQDVIAAEAKGRALVVWAADGRHFRLSKVLPTLDEVATPARTSREPNKQQRRRTPEQQRKAWEQACREDWRALLLILKARLVAVEGGFESWESAFLRWVVLPDGRLLGDVVVPQLAESYRTGEMPPLLPSGG